MGVVGNGRPLGVHNVAAAAEAVGANCREVPVTAIVRTSRRPLSRFHRSARQRLLLPAALRFEHNRITRRHLSAPSARSNQLYLIEAY
jgi:hypothetical protein